jgi:uncharacterized protein Yka (UPF0111/DUF47 family)
MNDFVIFISIILSFVFGALGVYFAFRYQRYFIKGKYDDLIHECHRTGYELYQMRKHADELIDDLKKHAYEKIREIDDKIREIDRLEHNLYESLYNRLKDDL